MPDMLNRDMFAMAAVQGAGPYLQQIQDPAARKAAAEALAQTAYVLADAMMVVKNTRRVGN